MQLHIEAVQTAKTGKSLRVKAGGDWYGANKDSGLREGMTIDASIEDGNFGKWIKEYRPVGNGSTNAAHQPQTSSSSVSGVGGAAPIWSNFVSNQVAHAIAAGKIETPEQIRAWAEGAKKAFVDLLA